VVIWFSSVRKGLHPFYERVLTNTTDSANFPDSSAALPLVIVDRMWWRAFGVAAVLLCVGVAGGYAVADRDQTEPQRSSTLAPVPAVSPSVPSVPAPTYAPDPDDPPLSTSGFETETIPLRVDPNGAGVKVDIPVGWRSHRVENYNQWNFVDPEHANATYLLRVNIVGMNISVKAAMDGRIAALEDAQANGGLSDFTVTDQTADTFEATYVDGGRLRFTSERWVSFDGSTAYASVAVTGREVDQAGMGVLLGRTISSLRELPAKASVQSTELP
jgi:hypothetical protein